MRKALYLPMMAAVIAALFGAAWWWVIMKPADFLDPEYGIWLAKMEMADAAQPPGTIAVLGDSCTVADLIPPLIGNKVIDLGLGGAGPIEAYFMAGRLLKKNHPGAVIVSFMPADIAEYNRFGKNVNLFDRAVKFGLLNRQDLEEMRLRSRELGDNDLFGAPSPLDVDARLKVALLGRHFPAYYFGELINGKLTFWKNENPRRELYAEKTRGYFGGHNANVSNSLDINAKLAAFRPPPTIDFYFRRLLEMMMQRGIPVYLVSMPINDYSFAAIKPAVKSDYAAYIAQLAAQYPGFHQIGDLMPTMPSNLYHDDVHLGMEGAIPWSRHIRAVLASAGIDPGPAEAGWQLPEN